MSFEYVVLIAMCQPLWMRGQYTKVREIRSYKQAV